MELCSTFNNYQQVIAMMNVQWDIESNAEDNFSWLGLSHTLSINSDLLLLHVNNAPPKTMGPYTHKFP